LREAVLGKQIHISDEELLLAYKQYNSEEAFAAIFAKYKALVLAVCYKYLGSEALAEDACMDIFEKLMHEFKRQNIQYLPAWLHTVSKNFCLQILRKQAHTTINIDDIAIGNMENDAEMHQLICKELQLQYMQEAIDKLNSAQKLCIELFYLQKQSYGQIQASTGLSYNDVKSNIQNGKRNLKILIQQLEQNR
jgi:RNA polymerase sigma factor (sigma-70 family)